jgi:hypothetical protein
MLFGRDFRPEEGVPGQDRIVMLSNKFWRERFGSDPKIIGKQLRLDQKPYTVVAVLRPSSRDRRPEQIWVPLAFSQDDLTRRENHNLTILAIFPFLWAYQANSTIRSLWKRSRPFKKAAFSMGSPQAFT